MKVKNGTKTDFWEEFGDQEHKERRRLEETPNRRVEERQLKGK